MCGVSESPYISCRESNGSVVGDSGNCRSCTAGSGNKAFAVNSFQIEIKVAVTILTYKLLIGNCKCSGGGINSTFGRELSIERDVHQALRGICDFNESLACHAFSLALKEAIVSPCKVTFKVCDCNSLCGSLHQFCGCCESCFDISNFCCSDTEIADSNLTFCGSRESYSGGKSKSVEFFHTVLEIVRTLIISGVPPPPSVFQAWK